jgi:hypothetical protein
LANWVGAHFTYVGGIAWDCVVTPGLDVLVARGVNETISMGVLEDKGSLSEGDTVNGRLGTDSNWSWALQIHHDIESVGKHGSG